MINNFKLFSHPSKDMYENLRPIKSIDFINFNSTINENYLDVLATDRVGNELLVEAAMAGRPDKDLVILNEGVVSAIYDSITKLIKAILSFIKGIINKLNLFVDSMTSNIKKWLKEVAPVVLERSKNPDYLHNLEYDGYKWNEQYITNGLFSSMGKIFELKTKIKVVEIDNETGDIRSSDMEIESSPNDISDFVESMKNKLKSMADHIEKKEKETSKPEKEQEKDGDKKSSKEEMKIDIPKIKPDENNEKVTNDNTGGNSNGSTYKKAIEEYLNREFSSTKEKYEEAILVKSHGGKSTSTINKFTSGTIKSHIDFISNSPNIINKIRDRYTNILDAYDKLETAIESIANEQNSSIEGSAKYTKYIKEPISDSIAFLRECTAINNTICRLNIRLVEDCTKEYIKICNKLALMKKQ